MSNKTTNYNLEKPLGGEYYDVNIHNANMDKIDTELKNLDDKVKSHKHNSTDITMGDNKTLEEFKADVNTSLGEMATDIIKLENKPVNDLEARNEIIDIKLKLKEQQAINFINKTGIGFFDTFMDNTYIDLVNSTATHNSTNKNVEFGNLTPYDVTAYEATTTNELKIKYPHNAKKGDLVKGTNEILNTENIGTIFDVQDTTVISGTYSIQGNGGRKLVRLDNGWLVAVVKDNDSRDIMLSKDNGLTWLRNGYIGANAIDGDYAITSKGNILYLIRVSGTALDFYKIDMTTQTDILIDPQQYRLESSATLMGNCSIAINEAKTELHACWSAKTSTYPGSFNLRYAKGTINGDGSVTWGTSIVIGGAMDSVGTDNMSPSIIVNKDGNPIVLYAYQNNNPNFIIRCLYYTGSAWSSVVNVYSGVSYNQQNPSAIYVPQSINGLVNGRIWVAWDGKDSVNTSYPAIRVSYSDDNGATWSAMQNISNDNTLSFGYPSITANKNNEIFILTTNNTVRQMKWSNDLWSALTSITSFANASGVSTLNDFTINFSSPLLVFLRNLGETKISFYGKWDTITNTKLTLKNPITATLSEKLNIVPQTQKLKMIDEIFDPFNSMDLNLYMNRMYKSTIKATVSNSKTIEINKSDKALYNGSKLWIDNKENSIENVVGQLTNYDVQDTTVISGSYSTQGNGGRKLVRLDNGTLVCGVINGTSEVRLYKSIDNGLTWSLLKALTTTSAIPDMSIVTDGFRLFCLFPNTNTSIQVYNINLSDGTTLFGYTPETGQTAMGNCSLAINEAKTELHACWASTNLSYTSVNIRYVKGTINSDGTITWGSVEQATTSNVDNKQPCIVITNNKPYIIHTYINGGSYGIRMTFKTTSWTTNSIYNSEGTAKTQNSPSAIYVPPSISGTTNGRIWVVWHGSDNTDSTNNNIRLSYSDDLGVTWSSPQKLTSGNTYLQMNPSITANKNNEVFIIWGGVTSSSLGFNILRKIKWSNGAWGSIENISNNSDKGYALPSTLIDFSINFSNPLYIFTKGNLSINFFGTWEDFGGYTLTMKDAVTLNTDDKITIIDMEVNQDGVALPLIAVDAEKFIYKATTLNTDTAKITVKGYENKVETIVYAIA